MLEGNNIFIDTLCVATRGADRQSSGRLSARVYARWKLHRGMADKCFLSGSVLRNWSEYRGMELLFRLPVMFARARVHECVFSSNVAACISFLE